MYNVKGFVYSFFLLLFHLFAFEGFISRIVFSRRLVSLLWLLSIRLSHGIHCNKRQRFDPKWLLCKFMTALATAFILQQKIEWIRPGQGCYYEKTNNNKEDWKSARTTSFSCVNIRKLLCWMLFDGCLPFSKGCLNMNWLYRNKRMMRKKGKLESKTLRKICIKQLVDELVFVSSWNVCVRL